MAGAPDWRTLSFRYALVEVRKARPAEEEWGWEDVQYPSLMVVRMCYDSAIFEEPDILAVCR
jgi:hypothetical protein